MPDVVLTICPNDSYVTLRVSDQGGGFPYTITPRLWEFSYTTVCRDDTEEGGLFGLLTNDERQVGILAGLGFGLPMSRVYAEYFNGSLDIVGLHGHGTDVFLRLQRLDVHADSLLV